MASKIDKYLENLYPVQIDLSNQNAAFNVNAAVNEYGEIQIRQQTNDKQTSVYLNIQEARRLAEWILEIMRDEDGEEK